MRVMVGMSGGVDSSVAAAELLEAGHDVVGVTLRLWRGSTDSGCCSVADVDDARRVAQQLGIDHVVFNFSDEFDRAVVDHYVDGHQRGLTPNPCIECNRSIKFGMLAERAAALGCERIATGHHARLVEREGAALIARGADPAKDQSYVVYVLDAPTRARTLFPIGHLTKDQVRDRAAALGLRTAAKPDSQDVCFVAGSDRRAFLGPRLTLHPGRVVDHDGNELATTDAVELVTVGQRRGLGLPGGGPKRFALDVDVDRRVVTVGEEVDLLVGSERLERVVWATGPVSGAMRAQASAHGASVAVDVTVEPDGTVRVEWDEPRRRVAAGQSIVLYDASDTFVLGGGIVTR